MLDLADGCAPLLGQGMLALKIARHGPACGRIQGQMLDQCRAQMISTGAGQS